MTEQKIQIADKETLDIILDKVSQISLSSGNDHHSQLLHYTLYGYDSYVYKNENILNDICRDAEISLNDDDIKHRAIDRIVKDATNIGPSLAKIYGLADDIKTKLNACKTLSQIKTFLETDELACKAMATNLRFCDIIDYQSTLRNSYKKNTRVLSYICNVLGLNESTVGSLSNLFNSYSSKIYENWNYGYRIKNCVIYNTDALNAIKSSNRVITCDGTSYEASASFYVFKGHNSVAGSYSCYCPPIGKFIVLSITDKFPGAPGPQLPYTVSDGDIFRPRGYISIGLDMVYRSDNNYGDTVQTYKRKVNIYDTADNTSSNGDRGLVLACKSSEQTYFSIDLYKVAE